MNDLSAFFANYPAAFPWMAGLFGLAIGSFLNVVVHRLPVMLERRWQSQCRELLNPNQPQTDASGRFDLIGESGALLEQSQDFLLLRLGRR